MERDSLANRSSYKIAVLGALLALCASVTYYFHFVLMAEIIFTHLFYVPIILAGLWWSRKGILVTVFLAVLLLISHVLSPLETSIGADITRATMFVVIGAIVGILNEMRLLMEAKLRVYSKTLEERTNALREAQEKQRAILDGIGDAVIVLDENLNITWANPLAVERYRAVLGQKCYQAVKWLEEPCTGCVARKVFTDGISESLEEEGLLRDGSHINFVANCSPVRDSEGKIVAVVEVLHDITERKQAQEALRESEEQLQTLIDAMPDFVCFKDGDGRWLKINAAGIRLFRLEGLDYRGKKDSELAELNSCLRGTFLTCAKTDKDTWKKRSLSRGEETISQPDGTVRIYDVIKTPVFHPDGERKGLVVLGHDITERKRAELALRESEGRFRDLFEGVPACCWTFDRAGKISHWNQVCEELYGWTAEQAIGKAMYQLMVKDENVARTQETVTNVFQGQSFQGLEYEDRRADGSTCNVLVSEYPLRDASGRIIMGICAELDITERVQAEEERARLLAQVREQAHQVQQIIATVPEGVLLLDAAERVVLANPVAEQDLAVLADAQVGATLTRLGDRPLAELLTSPPTKGLWHEVRTGQRIFEIIARPVEDGPEFQGWVLVIRDVTHEREIQQRLRQQQQLAAVGQLAAGIAHDFNNILAVIILYTQMGLSAPDIPVKLRKHLQTVSKQAQQAADLIQQILDFSRRAVLEIRPMDLTPFLKEIVKLLERTVPENIRISLNYGPDEYTVNADPTRLQQAIMNLVVNARDVMLPQGGGKLRIALSKVTATDEITRVTCGRIAAGEWVRIAVTDTGGGIPPDVLPHIFEPFFTTKAPGAGTGLGLAQVYGIVKQHEGHIDVSTKMEQGTTFTIYLPILQVQRLKMPPVETWAITKGQGETVLIVEDNARMREAIADILELLNYQVLIAANGQNALDILEKYGREIALVLSDLVMPVMGGKALFYALKQQYPKIKMIMLTGHPMEQELQKLQVEGLSGYLLKPPSIEQLAQMMAQVLKPSLCVRNAGED